MPQRLPGLHLPNPNLCRMSQTRLQAAARDWLREPGWEEPAFAQNSFQPLGPQASSKSTTSSCPGRTGCLSSETHGERPLKRPSIPGSGVPAGMAGVLGLCGRGGASSSWSSRNGLFFSGTALRLRMAALCLGLHVLQHQLPCRLGSSPKSQGSQGRWSRAKDGF